MVSGCGLAVKAIYIQSALRLLGRITILIGQIIFIEQRAIERQAQVLSFLVTDHSCFIREGVDGLDIPAYRKSGDTPHKGPGIARTPA